MEKLELWDTNELTENHFGEAFSTDISKGQRAKKMLEKTKDCSKQLNEVNDLLYNTKVSEKDECLEMFQNIYYNFVNLQSSEGKGGFSVSSPFKKVISKGTKLYRAVEDKNYKGINFNSHLGRMNEEGEPVLYTAFNEKVALREVPEFQKNYLNEYEVVNDIPVLYCYFDNIVCMQNVTEDDRKIAKQLLYFKNKILTKEANETIKEKLYWITNWLSNRDMINNCNSLGVVYASTKMKASQSVLNPTKNSIGFNKYADFVFKGDTLNGYIQLKKQSKL